MYSNDLVCDILNYIDENINNYISIDDITIHTFFNRFYIMKLFKKELKITINDYINKKRIYNSINQIRNTSDSFLKIALDNGFNSLEYFSETFKKIIGVNPSIFKKSTFFIMNIKTKDIITIRESIIKLNNTISKINLYKERRKPSIPKEKKLSIF